MELYDSSKQLLQLSSKYKRLLNYSVHVNIVNDEVMRVVGGQCNV